MIPPLPSSTKYRRTSSRRSTQGPAGTSAPRRSRTCCRARTPWRCLPRRSALTWRQPSAAGHAADRSRSAARAAAGGVDARASGRVARDCRRLACGRRGDPDDEHVRGSSLRLRSCNLEHRTAEIDARAVELAVQAANGRAWVSASVGPTGRLLAPFGDLEADAAYVSFERQGPGAHGGGRGCRLHRDDDGSRRGTISCTQAPMRSTSGTTAQRLPRLHS